FLEFFLVFSGRFQIFWFGFSEAAARRWSKTYRRRATLKKPKESKNNQKATTRKENNNRTQQWIIH
ncbi:MAG: hypothetical protein Q8P67_12835, partial [archaeon]|nr:hypothetical protein [archaeon]